MQILFMKGIILFQLASHNVQLLYVIRYVALNVVSFIIGGTRRHPRSR